MMFDLIVVGDTSEARDAAVAAGRLGARVALVQPWFPGWSTPGSAADWLRRLRDAIASCQSVVYPDTPRARSASRLPSPAVLTEEVIERDFLAQRVIQQRLDRLRVQVFEGQVRLLPGGELSLLAPGRELKMRGSRFVVATGTHTDVPLWASSRSRTVLAVDDLPLLDQIPRSLLIVGGGATGLEAAFLFSLLGSRVTLVDRQVRLALGDGMTAATLVRHLQRMGVRLLLQSEVTTAVENSEGAVSVELLSGERLTAERLLVTTERRGQTAGLGLEELGVRLDERGRLWCDERLQTWSGNVVGLGDVVGHPRDLAEKPSAPRDLVWSLLGKGGGSPRPSDSAAPLSTVATGELA